MAHLLLEEDEEQRKSNTLGRQAASFFAHAGMALLVWIALMLVGYAVNPPAISQSIILLLSFGVPLCAGLLINHFSQSEMAVLVWVLGLTWFMVVALWIVDMPTAANQCLQCTLGEKLSRTFFSIPSPSGLLDDDGPFLGTWPAAAFIGYAIGARLALRRREVTDV
jgi:hypothetical protein